MPSISDDDLCSGCAHCTYVPEAERHACANDFPGVTDDDDYVISCVEFMPRVRTYRHYDLDYGIAAEFKDTDEGKAQANAFMEANPHTGLLAVESGRIIIAALADRGTKP